MCATCLSAPSFPNDVTEAIFFARSGKSVVWKQEYIIPVRGSTRNLPIALTSLGGIWPFLQPCYVNAFN